MVLAGDIGRRASAASRLAYVQVPVGSGVTHPFCIGALLCPCSLPRF